MITAMYKLKYINTENRYCRNKHNGKMLCR